MDRSEWFKYFFNTLTLTLPISREFINSNAKKIHDRRTKYQIYHTRFILIREYILVILARKWRSNRGRPSTDTYLRVIFSELILPTPGRLAHSLGSTRNISVWPMTTRIHVGRHVRIFVFGWDHVWIKWQHGSAADADIRPLRDTDTRCAEQLGSHGQILSYIRIPSQGIPVHAFLHHRAVTYAAEIARVKPGSKYEIKTRAAGI